MPLEYPVGTTVINVTGSFLLGLLGGLALQHGLPTSWHLVLGTGFLGGYTTFITASVETVRLLQDRRWLAAAAKRFRPRSCGVSPGRGRARCWQHELDAAPADLVVAQVRAIWSWLTGCTDPVWPRASHLELANGVYRPGLAPREPSQVG
jgi:hypothetical protein